MHIAIITAGGAGMFCGSCMHDNTWARALLEAGAEVSLIPTYTPIRVDEHDQSERRVFLGGINLYLEHTWPLWRRIPRGLTRWLDRPSVIRWATSRSISNDASQLGDLTLDMLAGEQGPIAREIAELVDHITVQLQPDVVIFSNALLCGALRRLKERFSGPVYCTLQGDDVFTEELPESHRQPVIDALSERAQQFDGFFTHSAVYRDHMAAYLRLPIERFRLLPLGIDFEAHGGHLERSSETNHPFTVGYFARIAPEKGLRTLAEAALILHQRRPGEFVVRAGGYLNAQHRAYFEEVTRLARPLGKSFAYIGSPNTLNEKVAFYQSLDLLCMPTEFHEPKGLYVLEALASGVPVVVPRHGAFPELIAATGGGLLVEPRNPEAVAAALETLLDDREQARHLGRTGRGQVQEKFNLQQVAVQTLRHLAQPIPTS